MYVVKRSLLIAAVLATLGSAGPALAQHSIDVQRKTADGDYMAALVSFDRMPKRSVTTQARIAAAKSAWALSLPDRALEEYDGAVRQGTDLDKVDLARIYLGKAIIEHQENRHELAIFQAQKALSYLEDKSPLRAQVLSLWGESLASMKEFAPAEEKYQQALAECDPDSKPELAFLLGSAQYELGKYEDARINLETIPLRHDRAPEGIRLLAQIGVQQSNYDVASFWIEKGRHEFPDAFLDSWGDYVMLRGAIDRKDRAQIEAIRLQAEKRYPPSDPWLALLSAAAEEYVWKSGREEQK